MCKKCQGSVELFNNGLHLKEVNIYRRYEANSGPWELWVI